MLSQKKRRGWVIAAILLVVAGGAAVAGGALRGRGESAPGPEAGRADEPAVAVTVEPVTPRTVRRSVTAVGSLYGWDEVAITPKVEGRVVRIFHDVGDVVKPGEPLLEIDPTDYRLAVTEARRALDLELARLGLKQFPDKALDVTRLPPVARAASLQAQAGSKAERARRLSGTRAVSIEDLQNAETDLEVAQANYRQAVLEAEATLAAARHRQAALETAEQRLKDTRVVAPTPQANGGGPVEYVVCARGVAEGEIVRTFPFGMEPTPMFRLAIDRPLKLQVTVPERHRAHVKSGQGVALEVEAYPGEKFAGKVARV